MDRACPGVRSMRPRTSRVHLVHGRRRDSKVLLHFGLRRRASVDFPVVMDERQILPLFFYWVIASGYALRDLHV